MNVAAVHSAVNERFASADPEIREWYEEYAMGVVSNFAATRPQWERPTKDRIGLWRGRVKRDFAASAMGKAKRKEHVGLIGIWTWFQVLSLVWQIASMIWELYRTEPT